MADSAAFGGSKANESTKPPADKTSSPVSTTTPIKSVTAVPSTPDQVPHFGDYDEMIRIKVGTGIFSSSKTFEIYKGVLKFYSGYFRAAIDNIEQGRFVEAKDDVINLPDEQIEVFAIFKSWLFVRDLDKLLPKGIEYDLMASKLWAFGDRRQIPLLQNMAIGAIHRGVANLVLPSLASLTYAYSHTTQDSHLRRFIIFAFARRGDDRVASSEGWSASWPKEALADLAAALYKRQGIMSNDHYKKMDLCQWHVHEEGVRCKKS